MTMAQGGHSGAVQCLVPIGQFLFSADWNGDIKVRTAFQEGRHATCLYAALVYTRQQCDAEPFLLELVDCVRLSQGAPAFCAY